MLKRIIALILLLFHAALVFASPGYPMPAEDAFKMTLAKNGKEIVVRMNIYPGHYLYKERFQFSTDPVVKDLKVAYPKPHVKEDPYFGKQDVYNSDADLVVEGDFPDDMTFIMSYQGCEDGSICYLPVTDKFKIQGDGSYRPTRGGTIGAAGDGGTPKSMIDIANMFEDNESKGVGVGGDGKSLNSSREDAGSEKKTSSKPLVPQEGEDAGSKKFSAVESGKSNSSLNAADAGKHSAFDFEKNGVLSVLLAFFAAGLGLSFTACMYPLIPIVSGIIVGDKNQVTKMGALRLSFIYVQGLAITYTLVGVLAGLTGSLINVWLQKPSVIIGASILIALLAFSMLGFYDIQMPSSVQNYFSRKSSGLKGGKWLSVLLMGVFSALLVGPCVAPPLAFALGYIGKTGDALLGGLSLYFMALGTGVPLMLFAVLGAGVLPRSGGWMELVKQFFGLLLLLVAIYMATPYLPVIAVVLLYGAVLALAGIYLLWRGFKIGKAGDNGKVPLFVVGAFFIVVSLGILINGFLDRPHPVFSFLNLPVGVKTEEHAQAKMFTTKKELDTAIAKAFSDDPSKPVFVDFYADWCVTCKEMAHKTLNQPSIRNLINPERYFLVDVTKGDAAAREVLKNYGLYGPPGFFLLASPTKKSEPVLGFVTASELEKWIKGQIGALNNYGGK